MSDASTQLIGELEAFLDGAPCEPGWKALLQIKERQQAAALAE